MKLAEVDSVNEEDPFLDTLRWNGFGDYKVIEEIARGGMGVVYRARQISLNREVALKMILAGELAGQKALKMFQKEASAAAKMHHPNIVPVYEIGEHELHRYFTMHYVPGGRTIADWADSHRDDPKALASAAAKVARAVAHAHERGILHRDLKPSNVLWAPSDEPMVTDFGLAKLMDASSSETHTGEVVGSPSYMAPEQFEGKASHITTAADVYGIGAVLYELLSGRPPFHGASALETMRCVAQKSPPVLPYAVPRDLRVICMKCLEKSPQDRYSTAAALADDLERFSRGEPVSAAPLTVPQTIWRWALRKPALALLLCLFVCSVLVGMSGVIWQWREAERANAAQAATLDRLRWQEIERWVDEGESARALAYLASLIRANPQNWQAAMYAMSIVDQHSFPVLAGPVIEPPSVSTTAACLAPDASWIASAGKDQVVRIWDVSTGVQRHELPQKNSVQALATSAGPIALALATTGGLLIHHEVNKPPLEIEWNSAEPVKSLLFSASGQWLMAWSERRLSVWATHDFTKPALTLSFETPLVGAALAAQSSRLLVWTAKEASVWDAGTSRQSLAMTAREKLRHGAISADGQRCALLDGPFFARTWGIEAKQEFKLVESPLSILRMVALNHDGTRLTLASHNNSLAVHDVESALPVSTGMKHHYGVMNLVAAPTGRRTYSYGSDEHVRAWDAETGTSVMGPIWVGDVRSKADLMTSGDGSAVLVHAHASTRTQESLQVWRGTQTLPPKRHMVDGQRDSNSGRLSPDGRYGCIGLYPGKRAYVYELATGRVVLDRSVAGDVYVHLFSPDSRRCYVLTANGWVHGWSLETGEELWPPNQQPGFIRPGVLTPDGTRIIAGHNDGHIRIYDTANGRLLRVLDHAGEVKSLRLAPDNSERLLSASTNGIAHLWDLRSGAKIRTFEGHTHTIIATAWSPDCRHIATASYDTTVRVWDVKTGRMAGTPLPHLAWLSHLEFSPDGRLLATACRDGSTRLWNPLASQPVSPPLLQGTTCETVRFTADGAAFLVRDHDGFRFWDTERALPLTIHYQEPVSGGIGMDSESYRSIMTPDGTRVFLAGSMNHGAEWPVPQVRGRAPDWFAEFMEALAALRQDGPDHTQRISAGLLLKLRERIIKTFSASDIHARWARRVMNMAEEKM